MTHVRRREFITLLGGAVAAWPIAARAQQGPTRRVGVLIALDESDPEAQARIGAFRDALQKLGWVDGRNVHIDYRWASNDLERLRAYAAELVGLKPDVILAAATTPLSALQPVTRTVPIVFAQVTDPVALGYVTSLARPGGNITGFTLHEQAIGVKWLELLKQLAPNVTRVAVVHDPASPAPAGYWHEIEAVAPSFGAQVTSTPVRDAAEIERGVDTLARQPDGGLIVLPGAATATNRDLIVALAARHRLPTVYPYRYYVLGGGLVSYGLDLLDLYRGAASYADRILKGEKPGDLPIQLPTKFELVLNLKTAKALGLDPPIFLLARTDEVIE